MPGWTELFAGAFIPLLVVAAALAFLIGSIREQAVAATYLAVAAIQVASRSRPRAWMDFELWTAITDCALSALLCIICARWPARWVLLAAGVQLFVSTIHLAKLIGLELSRLAYAIVSGASGYPLVILLIWGSVRSWQRHRREQATG